MRPCQVPPSSQQKGRGGCAHYSEKTFKIIFNFNLTIFTSRSLQINFQRHEEQAFLNLLNFFCYIKKFLSFFRKMSECISSDYCLHLFIQTTQLVHYYNFCNKINLLEEGVVYMEVGWLDLLPLLDSFYPAFIWDFFTISNMVSMNMRLRCLSINDVFAVMTLLLKFHGLILTSTIIKKRKEIYSYLAGEKPFKIWDWSKKKWEQKKWSSWFKPGRTNQRWKNSIFEISLKVFRGKNRLHEN